MSEVSTYPRITMIATPAPLPTRDAAVQTVDAIATACRTASAITGFTTIAVHRSSATDVRVVAIDGAGRALVSQVGVDALHRPHLTTEILGVRDGTCHEILDRFDAAMDAGGIRSVARRRSFTGGVCATAGARDYLRECGAVLRPNALAVPSEESQTRQRNLAPRKANRSRGR
jgi:hypothetical protein